MSGAEVFIVRAVEDLQEKIQGKAIIACSGGVDSMVSAVLASRAIGDRLLAVYVNTGFMRKGETEEVRKMLEELDINFKVIDASDEFFSTLEGVRDPETKRKKIGWLFVKVFEREAKSFGAEYLVQGTIAPDVIESGKDGMGVIKSHHNVGGMPKEMGMTVVEPLIDLYKEDVREIARELKIKSSERQPFPGPGLSVRCLDEVNPRNIEIVREACFIVEDEIKKAAAQGDMPLPWQYFAVLLPIRSVGMQGEKRVYGRTVAVRVINTTDAMTATHTNVPMEVLDKISKRITNTMKDQVTRVVYDITDKPPATIEWE
jgi:GMP synthase (glutamine-hydrolysing)